jgi:excisionase family DNA binding protein
VPDPQTSPDVLTSTTICGFYPEMPRLGRPAGAPEWVSLGEASGLLGVSPDTLRRWGDSGRVSVFVTPGGHRRFNRSALERMLPSGPQPRVTIARTGITAGRLARAYRKEASAASHELRWLVGLSDDQREWFRSHGRVMAALLVQHLDRAEAPNAEHALSEVTAEAASYGRMCASLGLTLSETLEGFLRFRRPFLHELSSRGSLRGIDPAEIAAMVERADLALDRLLVAAMTSHSVERVGRQPSRRVARRIGPSSGVEVPRPTDDPQGQDSDRP